MRRIQDLKFGAGSRNFSDPDPDRIRIHCQIRAHGLYLIRKGFGGREQPGQLKNLCSVDIKT